MPDTLHTCTEAPSLQVHFGCDNSALSGSSGPGILHLAVPLLAGREAEVLRLRDGKLEHSDLLMLLGNGTHLVGAAVVEVPDRLEDPVQEVYTQVLAACRDRGMHLHRAWNYVPQINQHTHGLERYRQFNIGRWLAFEQHFGRDLRAFMPAASGVGSHGTHFALLFIAGRTPPRYLENPSQVPAYHYPTDYGPRPPGFARAVLAENAGCTVGYLSGTASIEGHRSVGEGDWHTQFRTTMHNIQIMFERMGMQDVQRPGAGTQLRDFRVYLRHPEMLPLIREWLAEETAFDAAAVTFLQADICRPELDLEMEAVLFHRQG